MFTEQQIRDAHAKVKTGADYPRYVRDLKDLGVTSYEYRVETGSNVFYGKAAHAVATAAKAEKLPVAETSSREDLLHAIRIHQQGLTDYPRFCKQAAAAGVEKWVSDLEKMTCNYYDKNGVELVSEPIPGNGY